MRLMNDRTTHPTRADDAIGPGGVPDQVKKRPRWRRAVGIHIANQVRVFREFEAFDECAAFADGLAKFQRVDRGKFRRDAPDHAQRVVGATVEHDDDLEITGVVPPEKFRIIAQHRFDAALLVVSRNQDEQAGVGHAKSVAETGVAINRGNNEEVLYEPPLD